MKNQDFFATRPVFTVNEFRDAQVDAEKQYPTATAATLEYYTRSGRLRRVRRGLYATVPFGVSPENVQVNPFLLAASMADDAVLAYQTALAFFGKSYSLQNYYFFCTHRTVRPASFHEAEYIGVLFPQALIHQHQEAYGVNTVEINGLDFRVTSLERTLVDVLDRPKYCGSWEEIWRSLEMIEYLDLDQVVAYAYLLDNATTIAKVGWYLEQHRDALMVTETYLDQLAAHRPKNPHYLGRGQQESSHMVSRWNLLVPESLYERSWEEPV
ncbi:MAG: type IV toxin-antitoxin system AbiEi family antitoxin domain-containing protein [bacterium]